MKDLLVRFRPSRISFVEFPDGLVLIFFRSGHVFFEDTSRT